MKLECTRGARNPLRDYLLVTWYEVYGLFGLAFEAAKALLT